jgi:isoamylase
MIISKGSPKPLGPSIQEDKINFALFSAKARTVSLCLFKRNSEKLFIEIPLSPETNKTGDIWHIAIKKNQIPLIYAYKITPQIAPNQGLLLDPYAKALSTSNIWGLYNKSTQKHYRPFAEVPIEKHFDWENDTPPNIPLNELIIYEMSVRAFTQDPSSNVNAKGTFLGMIEKIPHLIDLGVNAVELLPIQEFNECEYHQIHPHIKNTLFNFWGYSTVNFFTPMNRFASSSDPYAALYEFKTLVKKLHQHGIEVILDIVFNHTFEGDELGPILSFKGIDNSTYYIMGENDTYLNFSGCGNSLNANNPVVIEMILTSLCYWVTEMHVDGFRFDLASALTRDSKGIPMKTSPLIEAISTHPILSKIKLIAEPWDAAGLYQVGNFAPKTKHWSEWNDKYRDSIRRFIKGSPWSSGEFATRLCGSEDLYQKRAPSASINFITAHDGFSLMDLVSYNSKHNIENGEGNQDGNSDNVSWNCGEEGPTKNKKIQFLREKQIRNFHLALMLSQGVPMLTMGDEYGHSKHGNNNTWCHDSRLNWFQWDTLKNNAAFHRYYRLLIYFRKKHPILKRHTFLRQKDIDWHGLEPFKPDWNNQMPFVAFTLKDPHYEHDLYVAFNAQDHVQLVQLPSPPYAKHWRWFVNTSNPSPSDIFENKEGPIQKENFYRMSAFSAIVLKAT